MIETLKQIGVMLIVAGVVVIAVGLASSIYPSAGV